MSDDVPALIESRLNEIDEEAARLRRAISHLGPAEGKTWEPRRPRTSRRRAGGTRAGRGERQRQMLTAIKKMPGASPNELADAMGIAVPQVYGLLRKAEAKELIVKKGQGFAVVSR